jgi:DNA invertase Pin-like site-specific DNA recombinase
MALRSGFDLRILNVTVKSVAYLRQSPTAPNYEEMIRRFVTTLGAKLVQTFRDHDADRRGKDLLLAAVRARPRRFDVVVVPRVDHLCGSLRQLVVILEEFRQAEVDFVSIEDKIDSRYSLRLYDLVGLLAETERSAHREYSLRMAAAARRRGSRVGRPPAQLALGRAQRLRERGLSLQEIAARLGTSVATLSRKLSDVPKPPTETARHRHGRSRP